MRELKFSICIPTYNGSKWIKETLESILSQSFQNFETIISDDCSKDDTVEVIKNIRDKRIKIYQNKINLGYGKNLQVLRKLSKGDILFLMGQDDILLKDALLKTHNAFMLGEEIGLVMRPYYWFYEDVKKPVRAIFPYNGKKDSIISVLDGKREVQKIFESVGQLSGLAYRRKYMDMDFHEETFPAHIYPFASITKKYKVVYLKDYTIAVRIESSQTRFKKSIYDISPTESWVKMFNTVYREKKYEEVRKAGIEQTAKNYVGLVQLKNYSTFKNLMREILILIKLRPLNLLSPAFWFFSLGTIIIPTVVLRRLVDFFKNNIMGPKIKIEIEKI
jgi:glycosyltransferase involved in cell wall biosynthesis